MKPKTIVFFILFGLCACFVLGLLASRGLKIDLSAGDNAQGEKAIKMSEATQKAVNSDITATAAAIESSARKTEVAQWATPAAAKANTEATVQAVKANVSQAAGNVGNMILFMVGLSIGLIVLGYGIFAFYYSVRFKSLKQADKPDFVRLEGGGFIANLPGAGVYISRQPGSTGMVLVTKYNGESQKFELDPAVAKNADLVLQAPQVARWLAQGQKAKLVGESVISAIDFLNTLNQRERGDQGGISTIVNLDDK
jgi:hypothetical protein